ARSGSEKPSRPRYVSAWLGDRTPAYDTLTRLAHDLDVAPEWVMFGPGPATRRDAPDAVDATPGPRRGAQIIDFARLRDVTSRLVRLEAELQAIFRAFPDLYVWLDAEGKVLAYEGGSGGSLVGTLDFGEAAARVVSAVLDHFRVDRACFFELDRASGDLVCVATAGELGAAQWTGRVIPPRSSVAGLAVQQRGPVAARDVTTDPRVNLPAWLRERAGVEGHKSIVAVPLVSRGEVLGALSLASSAEREFSEPELGLLSGFAATAALALENARRFHETEQGKARAQAAAAHSERRLRNLAQDLTAIVWEVDAATWRTIYVSHAAEKILGYPVERWYTEGDFWLSHLHPDDRVRFLTMRLEPDSREDHELEYRMIAADGRVVWFSDFVHVVTDDDGVVRRLHGVMVDITEAKRAAEATRTLAETSRLLAQSLDRDALAHRIADSVRQLFDATVALLYQLEPGSGAMIALARSNEEDEFDWNLPPESGMVELAMRERRAVFSPDVLVDPRVGYTSEVRARIELGTVRAGLAVPLIARGT